ncbi:MAG TPA: NfeD family protein [Terriglobales bacterium]|nr:NfeD family protein [Terriglobales bacterium]
MKTFFRYLLFQIPQWFVLALFLWLLVDRAAVPQWASEAFFIFWVVKDLAIYPWVRPAYETNTKTGAEELIGAKGLAQEALDPDGYVKVRGELWKARVEPTDRIITPQSAVRVRSAAGMTLIVEPDDHLVQKPRRVP